MDFVPSIKKKKQKTQRGKKQSQGIVMPRSVHNPEKTVVLEGSMNAWCMPLLSAPSAGLGIALYHLAEVLSCRKRKFEQSCLRANVSVKVSGYLMIVTRTKLDFFENAKICVFMFHLSSVSLQPSLA